MKLADERFLLVGPPALVAPGSDGSEADRDSRMEGWLTEQSWDAYLPNGVSAAFDPIGGAVTTAATASIRDGGHYVTAVSWAGRVSRPGITAHKLFVEENRNALRELAAMLADGRISARLGKVMPLSEARQAYEAVAAGGVVGKIVLDPRA